ncbi:hypothetical protein CHARACLAT_029181 [Characodon lateralis]|uniref:Uncharacterized protein n=1 Tax=Characodon lateralis TaxID=208331 RepID=A0ABU7D1N6_9TELE|nr:hypothetical protein [Characodon lateralis]
MDPFCNLFPGIRCQLSSLNIKVPTYLCFSLDRVIPPRGLHPLEASRFITLLSLHRQVDHQEVHSGLTGWAITSIQC